MLHCTTWIHYTFCYVPDDLESLDEETYQTTYSAHCTFSTVLSDGRSVELVPGGEKRLVTTAERPQYTALVRRRRSMECTEQVSVVFYLVCVFSKRAKAKPMHIKDPFNKDHWGKTTYYIFIPIYSYHNFEVLSFLQTLIPHRTNVTCFTTLENQTKRHN